MPRARRARAGRGSAPRRAGAPLPPESPRFARRSDDLQDATRTAADVGRHAPGREELAGPGRRQRTDDVENHVEPLSGGCLGLDDLVADGIGPELRERGRAWRRHARSPSRARRRASRAGSRRCRLLRRRRRSARVAPRACRRRPSHPRLRAPGTPCSPACGSAAAVRSSRSAGFGTRASSRAVTTSAKPPQPDAESSPKTVSPTPWRVASGPTAMTVPETSDPITRCFGRNGAAIRVSAAPITRSTSQELSDTAATRTATSPGPGTGRGSSARRMTCSGCP